MSERRAGGGFLKTQLTHFQACVSVSSSERNCLGRWTGLLLGTGAGNSACHLQGQSWDVFYLEGMAAVAQVPFDVSWVYSSFLKNSMHRWQGHWPGGRGELILSAQAQAEPGKGMLAQLSAGSCRHRPM